MKVKPELLENEKVKTWIEKDKKSSKNFALWCWFALIIIVIGIVMIAIGLKPNTSFITTDKWTMIEICALAMVVVTTALYGFGYFMYSNLAKYEVFEYTINSKYKKTGDIPEYIIVDDNREYKLIGERIFNKLEVGKSYDCIVKLGKIIEVIDEEL